MFKDYSLLPDYLKQEELQYYFNEFLTNYNKYEKKNECLDNLYELVIRQCNTYEILKKSMCNQVEDYLIKEIDFESYDIMESILAIIPNLGLKKVYDHIIKHQEKICNKEILQLLNEAIDEYGDTVEDPYSGLRKFQSLGEK